VEKEAVIADNTVLSNFALIRREDILDKLFENARKLAHRRGVPISGTIGVLVEAIREGLLVIDEGNTMLSDMIEKGYFSPFETLDKLI